MDENALMERPPQVLAPLTIREMRDQVNLIQGVMKEVMLVDTHFGRIPGTPKPTLYKAGAEKLCFLFRLAPNYKIMPQTSVTPETCKYVIECDLVHVQSGMIYGSGIGSCSSGEKRYRRKDGTPPDPADVENTILKMAQKRAMVAATLSATAASDIFTQDIEDMDAETLGNGGGRQPQAAQKHHRAPAQSQSKPQNGGQNGGTTVAAPTQADYGAQIAAVKDAEKLAAVCEAIIADPDMGDKKRQALLDAAKVKGDLLAEREQRPPMQGQTQDPGEELF